MLHDAGPAAGRLARMRRRFPDEDAVIFGHSHIPLHETAADGFQIFNPGSPTERRRQPTHTMGLARIEDRKITFDLIALDWDSKDIFRNMAFEGSAEVTDPKAMRALAHPVRIALLEALTDRTAS